MQESGSQLLPGATYSCCRGLKARCSNVAGQFPVLFSYIYDPAPVGKPGGSTPFNRMKQM
jgi:hypothetical protein